MLFITLYRTTSADVDAEIRHRMGGEENTANEELV